MTSSHITFFLGGTVFLVLAEFRYLVCLQSLFFFSLFSIRQYFPFFFIYVSFHFISITISFLTLYSFLCRFLFLSFSLSFFHFLDSFKCFSLCISTFFLSFSSFVLLLFFFSFFFPNLFLIFRYSYLSLFSEFSL